MWTQTARSSTLNKKVLRAEPAVAGTLVKELTESESWSGLAFGEVETDLDRSRAALLRIRLEHAAGGVITKQQRGTAFRASVRLKKSTGWNSVRRLRDG